VVKARQNLISTPLEGEHASFDTASAASTELGNRAGAAGARLSRQNEKFAHAYIEVRDRLSRANRFRTRSFETAKRANRY